MKTVSIILILFVFPALMIAHADGPKSFGYLLQADAFEKEKSLAVERLATCGRDWIILDASFDGEVPWQREDLDAIRRGLPERKVIAYLSIGEAEDYRSYWHKWWSNHSTLSATAPAWLCSENPEWKGNYRVKYWNPDWQKIILDSVDELMAHGFDGVYLDIVDGFETFEQEGGQYIDDRINPETKQSYRRDMVDWVKAIGIRARQRNPQALVIPQNGSALLAQADFATAISGIGVEDLFTEGNKLQSKSHTAEVLAHLQTIKRMGKPVLVIEYPKRDERRAICKSLAKENALVWLVTDRQLKTLGESGK